MCATDTHKRKKRKKKYKNVVTTSSSTIFPTVYDIILNNSIASYIREHHLATPLLVWVTWLTIGTIFYGANDFNHNYYKGFYYSVNVGYSIGWGVLDELSQGSYAFSIFYLLIGATLISGSLVYLIESIVSSNEAWFKNITNDTRKTSSSTISRSSSRMKVIYDNSYIKRIKTSLSNNTSQAFMIIIWLVWILFGTIWSCYVIEWSVIEGIYFALSSLSTGGKYIYVYTRAYL